nr:hypothetical protein Ade03nite_51990 [Actinoplanes derwentensis]
MDDAWCGPVERYPGAGVTAREKANHPRCSGAARQMRGEGRIECRQTALCGGISAQKPVCGGHNWAFLLGRLHTRSTDSARAGTVPHTAGERHIRGTGIWPV